MDAKVRAMLDDLKEIAEALACSRNFWHLAKEIVQIVAKLELLLKEGNDATKNDCGT